MTDKQYTVDPLKDYAEAGFGVSEVYASFGLVAMVVFFVSRVVRFISKRKQVKK